MRWHHPLLRRSILVSTPRRVAPSVPLLGSAQHPFFHTSRLFSQPKFHLTSSRSYITSRDTSSFRSCTSLSSTRVRHFHESSVSCKELPKASPSTNMTTQENGSGTHTIFRFQLWPSIFCRSAEVFFGLVQYCSREKILARPWVNRRYAI